MITHVEYGGWKNNVKLSNDRIELIATLDVGPRIIRFGPVGGPNMFKEFPEQLGGTGEPEWQLRGGHRLWHSPEAKPRTYALDNGPVELEKIHEFSLRLNQPVETENGIRKQIRISMTAEDNMVALTHRLTNVGPWSVELAPWALTVMDAGGIGIVGLPEKRPHTEVLTPDFPLVLWPYTDLRDSRLSLGARYITLAQDKGKSPIKYGMANMLGWAAYLAHGCLFVKYFDYDPIAVYPDFGCNFETFTNEDMLEVESLGPLTVLEPGDMIEHDETWRLDIDVPSVNDEASIDRFIRPLIEQ